MFLWESTSSAQREIENCVAMMTNQVASVFDASSLKYFAYTLFTSVAASDKGPAGQSSWGCSQKLVMSQKGLPVQSFDFEHL